MLEQTLGEQILEEMQNINNRIDEVEQKQYSMILQIDKINDHLEQRMHNLEELLHALINQLQAKNANQAAIVINTSTTRIGG